MNLDLEEIRTAAEQAVRELLEAARLTAGSILVAGCSSSEIIGERIGTASSADAAKAVLDGIYPVLRERGVFLAAQCCEHLNRALIVEEELALRERLDLINVIPQPKAGGSFAAAAWAAFDAPAAVEAIRADAGMDIGSTLIGMHLKPVAVPVRTSVSRIGRASLVLARTRPKYIGGARAHYDEKRT